MGRTKSRGGVAYMTLPAMLESPANGNAFAVVSVQRDGVIKIDGNGTVPSRLVLCAATD